MKTVRLVRTKTSLSPDLTISHQSSLISGETSIGVAKQIDDYLREQVGEAAKSGKPIPKQSNVYEEIVKKGWESVKRHR